MLCYKGSYKMKNKTRNNVGKDRKSERKKITERGKIYISTSNTQIRNCVLSRFVTSIKSGGIKLVVWTKNRENVQRKLGCSHRHEHTLVKWNVNVNTILEVRRIFYVHTSTVVIFINVQIRVPFVFNMSNIYTLKCYLSL